MDNWNRWGADADVTLVELAASGRTHVNTAGRCLLLLAPRRPCAGRGPSW
jgi:hypothetical protein